MTDWLDRSLADLYRLLAALEAAGGDAFVQGLIDRVQLPADFAHPRVTVRSLLQLLNQTDGSTILPDEVVAFLRSLNQAVVVQMPGIGINPALTPPIQNEDPAEIVDMSAETWPIFIDHGAPLNNLLSPGPIKWVHDKITDANFPADARPAQTVRMRLVKFNRRVNNNEALAAIQRRGARPANIRELVALLRAEEVDLKVLGYSLVALGSHFYEGSSGTRYPYANYHGAKNRLQLLLCKHGESELSWEKDDHFLIVSGA